MKRQEVLETAIEYVMHDRNKDYKDPEDNFADIADLSNAFYGDRLQEPFTPLDVAIQSIFIKLARIKGNPYKMDNYVDIAGYAACAAECAENEQKRLNCLGVPEDTCVDGGVVGRIRISPDITVNIAEGTDINVELLTKALTRALKEVV